MSPKTRRRAEPEDLTIRQTKQALARLRKVAVVEAVATRAVALVVGDT